MATIGGNIARPHSFNIFPAVLLGLGIDYSPIDPIKALYWSAVLNGVIAVPMRPTTPPSTA